MRDCTWSLNFTCILCLEMCFTQLDVEDILKYSGFNMFLQFMICGHLPIQVGCFVVQCFGLLMHAHSIPRRGVKCSVSRQQRPPLTS